MPRGPRTERMLAQQRGELHYFTGRPCKHGHVCKRYTQTAICFDCGTMHTRKAFEADPEKYRERARQRIAKNPKKNRDRIKAWRKANPEKFRAQRALYKSRHKDQLRRRRNIYQNKKYHSDPAFKAKLAEYQKKRRATPEGRAARNISERSHYWRNLEVERIKANKRRGRLYAANPEKYREQGKRRYWNNRDEMTANSRDYRRKLYAAQRAAQIALAEFGIHAPRREALIALRQMNIKV